MLNVEEVRKSHSETVTKLKAAENDHQDLVKRLDTMEAETSVLKSKVGSCENEEKSTYDAYFLDKSTERDLEAIRKKTQQAKDAISAHSKMLESLNRCIALKEKEIVAFRKNFDSLRHQVWSSLFEQKAAAIPETIRAAVRELICIGLNSNRSMFFILPEVFPLPTNTEIQTIYKRLSTDLGIE